jgi:CRP-like cAMP-binding protein
MFGEIAVLTGEPRSASVVALSEVQYAEMSETDFMACLKSSPDAGVWLASRFASSVRRLTEQVFELSALNVQTRIRSYLLRLADKGERCSEGIVIRPAPTHQEFADRIGTSREAVSREFNWLSDQGIIRYDRESLTIIDLARLERETRR